MAVDTAQKRYAMSAFGDGDSAIMFEADSAVDSDDRLHLLGLYDYSAVATVIDAAGITLKVASDKTTLKLTNDRTTLKVAADKTFLKVDPE